MKFLFQIYIFLFSLICFSQGEANIWYFGRNAGLDFNDCKPFAITNGELNTIEGCSSFSDSRGNLLFYSDGTRVYNRNHEIMPNGADLLGDPSSSQSAMIIPKPGSSNIYYIFTVGANSLLGEPGFNYYTIDMNEDFGLGDVIEGPIDLSKGKGSEWSEKVAAVKGGDNGTFWVVSFVQREFFAYKVSKDGVVSNPSISSTPFKATDKRGYLKLSPNGKLLAIAHQADEAFILYDFNDVTGRITNERIMPLDTEGNKPYGVEFSSNSQILYVHASNDAFKPLDPAPQEEPEHHSTLFQFNLTNPSLSAINNSRTVIHTSKLFRGALQLGPDKKIYRSLSYNYEEGLPLLGVINNPNTVGLSCDYSHLSIGLLGRLSTQGLPPFIASIFSQIEIISEDANGVKTVVNGQTVGFCEGDDISIYSIDISGVPGRGVTFNWFYNGSKTPFSTDPILNLSDLSSDDNGDYRLEVTSTDLCGNKSILEGEFTIEIQGYPVIPDTVTLINCDYDGIIDGFTDFNLEDATNLFNLNNTNFTATYYLTLNDAETGTNALITSPFNNANATISNTVFARLENNAGCYSVGKVTLQVSSTSFPAEYIGEEIAQCDSDLSVGTQFFDLNSLTPNILAQFPLFQNLVVHYYTSRTDAQLNQNEITNPSTYTNETPFLQTLYVRVENKDTGGCFGIGPYVQLIVNPIPEFKTTNEFTICLNNPQEIYLEVFDFKATYTYEWRGPNGIIISSDLSVIVNTAGIYTVVATSIDGCESEPHEIIIQESDIASISIEDIEINDASNNNSIKINTSNLGIGDYEFALNFAFGEYQDTPIFEMVPMGVHTIFINDKNGCGLVEIKASVLGFPKFFTPNNDGKNDTWSVKGINENFYSGSIVHIFNRFGKIIAIIDPFDEGWNGLYNGEELPQSDYWFNARITDIKGIVREKKGHFSLIRRK